MFQIIVETRVQDPIDGLFKSSSVDIKELDDGPIVPKALIGKLKNVMLDRAIDGQARYMIVHISKHPGLAEIGHCKMPWHFREYKAIVQKKFAF